jgi:hypothetical protein
MFLPYQQYPTATHIFGEILHCRLGEEMVCSVAGKLPRDTMGGELRTGRPGHGEKTQ